MHRESMATGWAAELAAEWQGMRPVQPSTKLVVYQPELFRAEHDADPAPVVMDDLD
jgi:hypothetical protein